MCGWSAGSIRQSTHGLADFISAMDTDRIREWNAWYHLMNAGLRVKASGETDFPRMSGTRVGQGRSYVLLGGEPIRGARESAQWALACVDQLWRARSRRIADAERAAAEKAYEQARAYYRQARGQTPDIETLAMTHSLQRGRSCR